MLHEFLVAIKCDFFHLCSYAKISVAECFESRHPQKLVPQKTCKFWPQSAKISSAKINVALIDYFRVRYAKYFVNQNLIRLKKSYSYEKSCICEPMSKIYRNF